MYICICTCVRNMCVYSINVKHLENNLCTCCVLFNKFQVTYLRPEYFNKVSLTNLTLSKGTQN